MKATGVTRKIDHLGRITIPMELRKNLSINDGDTMEVFVDGDNIIYRKYKANGSCALCGEVSDEMSTHGRTGKRVCHECIMSPVSE